MEIYILVPFFMLLSVLMYWKNNQLRKVANYNKPLLYELAAKSPYSIESIEKLIKMVCRKCYPDETNYLLYTDTLIVKYNVYRTIIYASERGITDLQWAANQVFEKSVLSHIPPNRI